MADGISHYLPTHLTEVDIPQTAEIIDAPPTTQIALRFVNCPEPLVVTEQEFVLGRSVEHDRVIMVDLSPYRGYALGVSRHHAVVANAADGCTIKDLGSANGTWLNGTRLSSFVPYPLVDGDQIQLGHLSITIHFVSDKIRPI